ncbi:TonB family protein [Spirosoma sp. SC4-14]|uniref:TonB family protein n=1 Tax=Spirosoma sp. SC4-14 TaxID=3128900 RepID=UPI0030CCDF3E
MNALDYFLKANLYGLLFASCYWLLLRKHTFLTLNRSYLLASVLLTLLLPLMSLPTQTVDTLSMPVGIIALPTTTVVASAETEVDWEQLAAIIYATIALGLFIRLIVQINRVAQLIRQLPWKPYGNYVLVEAYDAKTPTFSFFNYIVLNPADTNNSLVLKHELVHVKQRHSIDVMVVSALKALFWACPTLWLIDRMLRQVHEFIADLESNPPSGYAQFLVDYSLGVQPVSIANGFFKPSLLRQRIQMLHRSATTRWALGKYTLVLPLALLLLAMTTDQQQLATVVDRVTGEAITVSGQVTNKIDKRPLPGATVLIAGTEKGASTDSQGRFILKNVPKDAALVVSFVGFATQAVDVEARSKINIALAVASPNELPKMGATAMYKRIKPNLAMPVRVPPSSETINGTVYTAVEEPAVFPTGVPGLMQYIAHALHYPATARTAGVQGVVFVEFMVLPTGRVGSATVKKGIGSGCDEEALRVVRQMPKWIPAKQQGRNVSSLYQLPIEFALEKKARETGSLHKGDTLPNADNYGAFMNSVRRPVSTVTVINGRGPLGPLGEKPLYIVDEVEVTGEATDSINPNTIESVEVLKDAAAIAQYGEKGKYGVIIIKTKPKTK